MNHTNKDFEILSAYLDGELSPKESREVEEKIAKDSVFKKKFEELKSVKHLTQTSIKRLDEDPFFETKLMSEINSDKKWTDKVKKYSPAIGFAVLAIVLMIFFKSNPNFLNRMFEEQKTQIAGFYEENLMPLLYSGDINSEDIFNFAFSRQLPIDKSTGQYIEIGYNPNNSEYFEIKNANEVDEPINYDDFVQALKLKQNQKLQMDSILESYSDELQEQILVNDNNTVAINPNLWKYNKAIFADIMAFAEDANKEEFVKIIPAGYKFYDKPEVEKFVKQIKTKPEKEYIFFTPDTIFKSKYYYDKEKVKKDLEKFEIEWKQQQKDLTKAQRELERNVRDNRIIVNLQKNLKELKKDSSRNKFFNVYVDSNICRVELDEIVIPEIDLPNFDSIEAHIEEATKNLKSFSISIPRIEEGRSGFNFKIETDDSIGEFNFDVNLRNLDSLHRKSFNVLDSLIIINDEPIPMPNIDSILSNIKIFSNDSTLFKFDNEKLEKQMKRYEEKMKKFDEKMKKYEFKMKQKQDSVKSKKSSGVEIIN